MGVNPGGEHISPDGDTGEEDVSEQERGLIKVFFMVPGQEPIELGPPPVKVTHFQGLRTVGGELVNPIDVYYLIPRPPAEGADEREGDESGDESDAQVVDIFRHTGVLQEPGRTDYEVPPPERTKGEHVGAVGKGYQHRFEAIVRTAAAIGTLVVLYAAEHL